jgi:membrane protein YdbS with pleckstrin-like domain
VLQVAPEFESVTETGEKILWQGKPVFVPFVLHAIPILGLAIFWGAFYLGMDSAASGSAVHPPPTLYLIIFLIMRSFPVWGSILYCIYVVLLHGNTLYAYTNRRMLMRGGLFATSFKSIDYDRIQELDVTAGLLDRLFDVGTVRAFSGSVTAKGARIYDRFVSIRDPYGVYRAIKGVEVDAKTDWNYPNALRPAINPGYTTEYKP